MFLVSVFCFLFVFLFCFHVFIFLSRENLGCCDFLRVVLRLIIKICYIARALYQELYIAVES